MEENEHITAKNQPASKNVLLNIEVMVLGGAALVLAILMVSKNTASFVLAAGVFVKFFAFVVGALMGWAGVFTELNLLKQLQTITRRQI